MIIVTGGTGLVGGHLLYQLTQRGEKIKALIRTKKRIALTRQIFSVYTANPDTLINQIEWVEGDVLDALLIDDLIQANDTVYHCAAAVSFDPKDAEQVKRINIEGVANVVNACLHKQAKKLCYVSSIAALGRDMVTGLLNEDIQALPSKESSLYSKTKYAGEKEVWRGIAEGLNAVIVNPGVILGVGGNWQEGSSRLFSAVHKGMKFYTKGVNGYIDVRDVVKAMLFLVDKDIQNERYVLVAENVSYQTLLTDIANGLGKPAPPIFATNFLSGLAWRIGKLIYWITGTPPLITKETARTANKTYYYDNTKITQLGFEFIPIKQSIEEACAFYKQQYKG